MRLYKKLLFSFCTLSFAIADCSAQADESTVSSNRIYFSSGYFENTFNSNEGMSYFPMSVYETYNWGFEKLSYDSSKLSRFFSWLIGGQILPLYVHGVTNTSFHEFGHATRDRRYGFNDIYYRPNDSSKTVTSFFSMFFERFATPFDGASTGAPNRGTADDEADFVISAGGMNNEILLSKLIAERIHERGGSVPDLSYYLNSKLGPYGYSTSDSKTGDPERLVSGYSRLGKNITRKDFQNHYLFSTFASGTFYSLLWGNIDYLRNSQHRIKPLSLGGFTLPDFYTYLNTKGISTEAVLHYQATENIKLGLSYERIYEGDSYDQISPEILFQINNQSHYIKNYSLKPQLVIGIESGRVDLGGSVLVEATTQLDVGMFLKYTYYNKNTLYGERNSPFASHSNELLAGAYYVL
ncbi:hypothetical protein [Fluviispira multicolorata]|uniref:Uncharacterized protein n=1 Tax=Fluviispira multicolorata TaxID=2654512 RepID=A0A833JE23_9BACT|nr:hypothetical protein [Fluviispira multicolorata]KAB8029720.1 hypothetical protein GCL57_09245 [Fluviispira multicolorata]